ncbi:MAG: hypothetical protein PWP37_211 [Thermotogota bacterium]|nr:hypothetical protein [Thermotogota bacterium]MDK2864019.1 hypothetical protein [Thermotogota bacterium]HCZ06227.1 hypothetical protein [Thermotogota bacterium]
MKKLSIVLFLILFSIRIFALEFSDVVNQFKTYIDDYRRDKPQSELIATVKEELVNLAVYRLYKIQMVGSLEKRELSLTSSDFLTKLYDRYQPSSLEEKIAFAAFLAYLVSDLQGKSLDESTVMKMPAFATAFNIYRTEVRNALSDLLANDLLYLVGLAEKPVISSLSERRVAEITLTSRPVLNIDPGRLEGHREILGAGLLEGLIDSAKEFARRLESEGSSWSDRRILAEARRAVLELINRETGYHQKVLASSIVSAAPKKLDLGWLRFIAYSVPIVLMVFIKRFRRFAKWMVFFFVVVEALYILFLYNPMGSVIDSYIYAITVIPTFVFASLLFIVRLLKGKVPGLLEKTTLFLGIAAVLLGFGVSAYRDIPEIRMENFGSFHGSVYYGMLKEDVYTGDVSPLKQTVVELNSLVSKEVNQTQDTMRKLMNFLDSLRKEGAFSKINVTPLTIFPTFPSYSSFFEIQNSPHYREEFSDLVSILNNFTAESKIRYKQINRAVKTLEKELQDVIPYGDETFRKELMDSINSQLSRNRYSSSVYSSVKSDLESLMTEPSVSASIKVFQFRYGIITVLALAIATIITVIRKGKSAAIMGALAGISSFMAVVNWGNLRIFVQQGVPNLIVKASSGFHPWFFVFVMAISVLFIIINLRREA